MIVEHLLTEFTNYDSYIELIAPFEAVKGKEKWNR